MVPAGVDVVAPVFDDVSGVVQVDEPFEVEALVAQGPLNDSMTPFCVGLPGSMKCSLSSIDSASSFFNRTFSCSSWRRRAASGTFMPLKWNA